MSDYLYLPPYRNILAGAGVASSAGVLDSDHPVTWLTDLRTAYPARWDAGAWGATITPLAAGNVQLIVLANHSLDANVTVGGGVSGTITVPAALENSIRLNPYLLLSAAVPSVSSLTLAGTNTLDAVIGEVFAGVPLELTPFQMSDMQDGFALGGSPPSLGDYMNVPKRSRGIEMRRLGGSQIYTTANRAAIESWWRSQDDYSKPSVLIMDRTVNDARVVLIENEPVFQAFEGRWKVQLSFIEYPRYKWL